MKFENRHSYIGGSDFGSVLEKNPYKKRIELVMEKAQVLANTFDGNEATERGTLFEDLVIDLFEKETGKKVIDRQKTFEKAETEMCMKLLCHVDAMIEGEEAVFEAKTTSVKSKTWDDGIPEYYKAQLEFNCFLAECQKAYIAVAFCDDDDNIVDFKYFEYIPEMTDIDIIFYSTLFSGDVKKYREKFGVLNSGKIVDADNSINAEIEKLEELKIKIEEIKKELKPFETQKKKIEDSLKALIGQDWGIKTDLYKITLGNRITSPKTDYEVARSLLKIEYL